MEEMGEENRRRGKRWGKNPLDFIYLEAQVDFYRLRGKNIEEKELREVLCVSVFVLLRCLFTVKAVFSLKFLSVFFGG